MMSPSAIVGAVVAIFIVAVGGTIAAVHSPNPGEALGLITAITAPTIAALFALAKADKSQQQTNGSLDTRIRDAIHQVLDERETK